MGCGASQPAPDALSTASPTAQQQPQQQQGQQVSSSHTLQQPEVSAVEAFAHKHSKAITTTLKFAAGLVGATGLPGASALAGAMLQVAKVTSAAKQNQVSCQMLFTLVKAYDTALDVLPDKQVLELRAGEQLAALKVAMEKASGVIESYGQGKVPRLIMAISAKDEFAAVKDKLMVAMAVSSSNRGGRSPRVSQHHTRCCLVQVLLSQPLTAHPSALLASLLTPPGHQHCRDLPEHGSPAASRGQCVVCA